MRLHRWSRPVRRQLQQLGRTFQLLLPITDLLLQHLALQPFALPHRIVGILHRQLCQRRL